jgi:hypothetical protein
MSWLLRIALLSAVAGLSTGCAMCCAPFDCDYPSVPGRWMRHNPSSGRVGSAFDEAGGPAGVAVASAEDIATAEPAPSPTPAQPLPPTRSVIPRNLGESYLPQ